MSFSSAVLMKELQLGGSHEQNPMRHQTRSAHLRMVPGALLPVRGWVDDLHETAMGQSSRLSECKVLGGKAMNMLRLLYQHLLSMVAIPLGFNDRLTQFCDRCGRTKWAVHWWDDSDRTEVWKAVAWNVNGHHHGCFCPACFTVLARKKNIRLIWRPIIEQEEKQ